MPTFFNDGLDDTLAYDYVGNFAGGQASSVRANLLQDGQYSESRNMDIDKFGAIITRRGTEIIGSTLTNPIQGLVYMDTPSIEQLLAVSNGVVYKSTGSSWSSVSGYTPSASNNVEAVQFFDKVYFSDSGGTNVHSYDGSSFTDEGDTGGDPPRGKFLASHTGRLFAANTPSADDEIQASDVLSASSGNWSSNYSFRVGKGEGDPITGIISWYNFNLLVFKEHSIHIVATDPSQSSASAWSVHRVDNNVGCVSHRSIAQAGSDVFFLARDGVRTVKTILAGAQSSVSEPISQSISDIIERINWGNADTCCAKFWNNRYILSVPLDSATTPDHILVFNTVTKSWSGFWTGWTSRAFATTAFSGFPKLVMGHSDGKVVTWMDYVAAGSEVDATFQDGGGDIPSHVVTRGLTFQDVFSKKLGNHVELELRGSTPGADVELRAIADESDEKVVHHSTIITGITGVTLPANLTFVLPEDEIITRDYNMIPVNEFSELQFRVFANSGKVHLRNIKASAFMNSMTLEKTD